MARSHKYIYRIKNGRKYRYFYTQAELDRYRHGPQPTPSSDYAEEGTIGLSSTQMSTSLEMDKKHAEQMRHDILEYMSKKGYTNATQIKEGKDDEFINYINSTYQKHANKPHARPRHGSGQTAQAKVERVSVTNSRRPHARPRHNFGNTAQAVILKKRKR